MVFGLFLAMSAWRALRAGVGAAERPCPPQSQSWAAAAGLPQLQGCHSCRAAALLCCVGPRSAPSTGVAAPAASNRCCFLLSYPTRQVREA